MPKKTKKEKLLAETHRQPIVARRAPVVHSQPAQQTVPIAPSELAYTLQAVTPKETATTTALRSEYTAIKHDLIKTIVWSALIVVGELLLSRYVR